MTTAPQRQILLTLLEEACAGGARMRKACTQIGLSLRTVERWLRQRSLGAQEAVPSPQEPGAINASVDPKESLPTHDQTLAQDQNSDPTPATASTAPQASEPSVGAYQDRRLSGLRQVVTPHNKLTPRERQSVLDTVNSQEYKDLPPSQIVPRLADQGHYIASESTMQRIMREAGQTTHRRTERIAQKRSKPFALKATMVNQIYTWDITYLPTEIKGQYFYLYLFVDIFSRYIVGAQVFESESAELAADLLKDICQRHGITRDQVRLHSDNGSPMKGQTMLAMMQELGVIASRSRPSVSNDNPYSESLFRTLKYRPLMPLKAFETIEQARLWVIALVDWYNQEHRHSAIKFVTPAQRHRGLDEQLLHKRTEVYAHARDKNPRRWSKNTRNWTRVTEVHLNPDKPISKESKHTEN
jgi:putative transposase